MEVTVASASELIDRFEELLSAHGISVPQHSETGADMLSMWKVLERVRAGFRGSPDELRHEYTAGLAAHDLAAKLLDVSQRPQLADLVPHLELLAKGAIDYRDRSEAIQAWLRV